MKPPINFREIDRCPKCGGEDLGRRHLKTEDDTLVLVVWCRTCRIDLLQRPDGKACTFCARPAFLFGRKNSIYRCLGCYLDWFVAGTLNWRKVENLPEFPWSDYAAVKWEKP